MAKPARTRHQTSILIWLSLAIIALLSCWVIGVTLYTRLAIIDAREGLGWSLAAAISSASDLKLALAAVAAIVTAGLTAAGAARQPLWATYAAGALIVSGLVSSIYLWGLLGDATYINEYRGTSPFLNIRDGEKILLAAHALRLTLVLSLSSALAALLGITIVRSKADG